MKALKSVNRAMQYLWEGAARIFSPSQDQYPNIGVQPYEGEIDTKLADHGSR